MDGSQVLWIGVALALGAALQGAIGFAFGMLAIPIMVHAGVSMPRAVALALVLVMVQTGWGIWRERSELDARGTLGLLGWRLVSMPVGLGLMEALTELGPARVKQVVGLAIGLALVIKLAARVTPRATVHGAWTPVAGLTSGLMSGLVGMGGPPVVLWVMAHDWSTRRARVFLWTVLLELAPVQLALMVWRFGAEAGWAIPMGLAFTPVVVLGTIGGAAIGSRLSRRHLRVAAYAVLAVIALVSVAAPWVGR